MSQQTASFRFPAVPLEPVDAGTNLLVSGPSLGGARELLLGSLVGAADEGTIIVAADANAGQTLTAFERVGGDADRERLRIVDCAEAEGSASGETVTKVASPGDLTGIGMGFSSSYEGLYADGYRHVRTGIYTLSPMLVYAEDVRPVFRFLHTLTGRIRSMDGLGVCAIDPGTQDERTCSSVAQAFDARIDLRQSDGGTEIRVQGLDDQPEGWRPYELTAAGD